jgi:hypothetical protein
MKKLLWLQIVMALAILLSMAPWHTQRASAQNLPIKSQTCIGTDVNGAPITGTCGGGLTAQSAPAATVTQTGSNIQLMLMGTATAPFPAGTCLSFDVLTTATGTNGGWNLYLYVDGSQVSEIYSGGSTTANIDWTPFRYCNNPGSTTAQIIYFLPTQFNTSSTAWAYSTGAGFGTGLVVTPTAVNWTSSSHTFALYTLGTSTQTNNGVIFRVSQ